MSAVSLDDGQSQASNNRRRNYGSTDLESPSTPTAVANAVISSSTASTPLLPHYDSNRSTLSFIQRIGFGLGHIYNDLCAGVWFSYTLLFMQAALLLPALMAGALVMFGQVSDAIGTPIVGYLSDRYGTKRKWHVFGTALVFVTFPMIFSLCPWCNINSSDGVWAWWPPVYFGFFIVLFQFAWAMVQITHLAMIPEMSMTTKDRSDLTAIRYSASIVANVIVYVVTWCMLQGHSRNSSNIGPQDAFRFRDIALLLTLIGLTMSVLFHFSLSLSGYERRRVLQVIPQKSPNNEPLPNDGEQQTTNGTSTPSRRRDLLKSPLLYQNALLYVFARLFMTTALVYMPLWLDERSLNPLLPPSPTPDADESSLHLFSSISDVQHLATVPLASFLSSFLSSMCVKYAHRWIPHSVAYMCGSTISLLACSWIAFVAPVTVSPGKLYAIAVLFGAGSSITMISSLCITADMIGRQTHHGGFIYSAVTFADKFITGIIIVIIETLKCANRSDCPRYYRNVLSYLCGGAALLGILTLLSIRVTAKLTGTRSNTSATTNLVA